jgi:lipoprotein-anchoring transpeptidase ErfK/SrfK
MQRVVFTALVASALGIVPAFAEPMSLQADRYAQPSQRRATPTYVVPQTAAGQYAVRPTQPVRYAAAEPQTDLGGGFIEFLFGGGRPFAPPRPPGDMLARVTPHDAPETMERARPPVDPKFDRQVVHYHGPEKPGTIIIDTPQRFLFLVQADGTAVRYGIGVGRPGFTWAGVKNVSAKKEWPDWVPPPEMLQRQPGLPGFMAGGPENPLGARAMYLGSSLYRIHGSNEPWTIGQAVSSGCIRMRNEDVMDLYDRVKVGTKVVVI